jgi:hypothetical protein
MTRRKEVEEDFQPFDPAGSSQDLVVTLSCLTLMAVLMSIYSNLRVIFHLKPVLMIPIQIYS